MTTVSEKTALFEGQSTNAVLGHLNRRLRELNKPELKVWKASREKLIERIVQTDLDVAFAQPPEPKPEPVAEEIPSLSDSALSQTVAKPEKPKKATKTVHPAHLARGLETDLYAKNCRERVRDIREAEKKANKKPAPEKKAKTKKEPKAQAAPRSTETNPNHVTVADIARELGINPKVARNKLRRRGSSLPASVKGESAWTFSKKDKAVLVEILSGI